MEDRPDRSITELYTIDERLGKGAYGIVWKASDKETGEIVAVKKIFDAFRNETDAQRTFREIQYLQKFVAHPNIVSLLNVVKADNDKDIYLVFDHMDTDLYNARRIIKPPHVPYIMYQIISAINYLHSGGVIHRDLKPQNVLVNDECLCKLADFGLARSVVHRNVSDDALESGVMTDYVATRWYRSPEILLGSKRYTTGTDIWSAGCILGELLGNDAMYRGSSSYNQVEIIIQSIGRPSAADVKACQFSSMIDLSRLPGKKADKSFEVMFPRASPQSLDLLHKMLQFNPDKRLTAEEALRHPYLVKMYDPACEITLSKPVVAAVDDNKQLTIKDYRTRLYREIRKTCQQQAVARASPSPSGSPKKIENERHSTSQPKSTRHTTAESFRAVDSPSTTRRAQTSRSNRSGIIADPEKAAISKAVSRPPSAQPKATPKADPSKLVAEIGQGAEIVDVYGYPSRRSRRNDSQADSGAASKNYEWASQSHALKKSSSQRNSHKPPDSLDPLQIRSSRRATPSTPGSHYKMRDPLQISSSENHNRDEVLTDIYGRRVGRKSAHSRRNDSQVFTPDPPPSRSRVSTPMTNGRGDVSRAVRPDSGWRDRPTGLGRESGGDHGSDTILNIAGRKSVVSPPVSRTDNSSRGLPWQSRQSSTRPW